MSCCMSVSLVGIGRPGDRPQKPSEIGARRAAAYSSGAVATQGSKDNGEIRQLAHDLNNALYAVNSAVELLRRRLPAADARAAMALEAAKRNVDCAVSVAQRLLALTGQGAD